MAEKQHKASIGVKEFYYGRLNDSDLVTEAPEHVRFLQSITVSTSQEIVKAYGDDTVAEMAVSNGDVTVSSGFHRIPMEDKVKLYGLEDVGGLSAYGPESIPPDVAVVFARSFNDGSKEWFGLLKGKFMMPETSGATKEASITFSSEETSAEFMPRMIAGGDKEYTYLIGKDAKGETTKRDAMFMAVFGQPFPSNEVPEGV